MSMIIPIIEAFLINADRNQYLSLSMKILIDANHNLSITKYKQFLS